MATGPSSSAAPYLLGVEPNVRFVSIATVGDTLDTKSDGSAWRMVGISDGLGAFDNGDGTITVLMNHELGNTQGIVRDHGAIGAFVSRWVLDKSDLSVVSAGDAIQKIYLWDDALAASGTDTNGDGVIDAFVESTYAVARFCSADLAPVSAYEWTDPVTGITYGTSDRIFMAGEESGTEGKEFGVVATGVEAGNAYELAHTGLFAWENAISSPYAQLKTINIGMDDGQNGQVYVYIGDKKTTGTAVDKAGLNDGNLYGIKVVDLLGNAGNETDALAASGRFELYNHGDVSAMTGAVLDAASEAAGVTSFMRPEDGQFDPTNPNVFYFVTTASVTGQSRLYKLTFDDIAQPELGGSIEAVLSSSDLPTNGSVGPRMMDNITVTAEGKVIIQEDVGNNAHVGRVLEYDPATDTVSVLAQHDPALYTGSAATNPTFKTMDEESSGVIDVTNLLGDADTKAYLLDVQSHNALVDPELVQDGQFLAMFVDDPQTKGTDGNDTLNGSYADETFFGKGGNDTINAGSGNDQVRGGAGNDTVDAGAGNDKVFGDAGNDTLLGGTGNDNLDGGDGNDVLDGGAGRDGLTGGKGADLFVFGAATDSIYAQMDWINDFNSAEGDRIDLSGVDAITGGADDAFTLVSSFSGVAGELKITANAFGTVVAGDTDGDGLADFAFKVKSGLVHDYDLVL